MVLTTMVVHSSAAATSERDCISPVHRFPIFLGAFKVVFLGAAGIAETWARKESRDKTTIELEANILSLLPVELCLNYRLYTAKEVVEPGKLKIAESRGPAVADRKPLYGPRPVASLPLLPESIPSFGKLKLH